MQLAVDDLVVPDLAERRRVHVDRYRATLMVHSVDSRRRRTERLPGFICLDATGATPDDERLARSSTLQHMYADARAPVIMEARVSRLPPRVEPRLRVLVAPQELERPFAATLEGAQLDTLRRGAREGHAFLGSKVVIRERRCCDAVEIGHSFILHRNSGSMSSGERFKRGIYNGDAPVSDLRIDQRDRKRAGWNEANTSTQVLRSWRRSTRTVKASFSRRLCRKTSRANRRCRLSLKASSAKAITAAMRRGVRPCPRDLGGSEGRWRSAGAASSMEAHPAMARLVEKLKIDERELEAAAGFTRHIVRER